MDERTEIAALPAKYKPIGAWAYFWLSVLYAIPLLGFIFLLIHAIGAGNINVRRFARSHFCGLIIALVVGGIAAVLYFFLPGLSIWLAGILSGLGV